MMKYCYVMYISQFETHINPPKRKGFHRHHIVPKSQGRDDSQVYLTPAQHLWAHILYDRMTGKKTSCKLIAGSHIRKQDIHCYEDCLSYNDVAVVQSQKASDYRKGRKLSMEVRQKISKNHAHYNKGKHCSDETKEKIRQSRLGWCPSQETRQRMSESRMGKKPWNYGKHHSEETCKKLSDLQKGEKNHWYGCHWYNNGVISIRAEECPEGFVIGRLRRTK